jgi:hypothetical protein
MTQRIYSSRNTFGGNVPPQQKKCPQCERYKEAAFRDAIEFDKFRTMLKIADDMLITLRAENEKLRAENGLLMAENRTESERLKEACDGYLAHAAGLRDENAKLLERIRFADQEFAAECAALRGENERLKDCNVELETRRNDAERERHTLRAENERLTRCCNGDVERERNELRAENERLREALEKIAVHHWCEIEIEEIAHAALTAIHVEESAPSAGSATYNERWKSKP